MRKLFTILGILTLTLGCRTQHIYTGNQFLEGESAVARMEGSANNNKNDAYAEQGKKTDVDADANTEGLERLLK